MASEALPSPEVLRQLLRYDPETGYLFWLPRVPEMFGGARRPAHSCANWNSRFSQKRAFTALVDGYGHGHVLWAKVRAHRVAWAIYYGQWPEGMIDHINGIRDDNRIDNLRIVDASENSQNSKRPKNNTSGVIGVCRDKQHGKWRAQISYRRNHKTLGVFRSFDDAVAARRAAEEELGYHQNHGRT